MSTDLQIITCAYISQPYIWEMYAQVIIWDTTSQYTNGYENLIKRQCIKLGFLSFSAMLISGKTFPLEHHKLVFINMQFKHPQKKNQSIQFFCSKFANSFFTSLVCKHGKSPHVPEESCLETPSSSKVFISHVSLCRTSTSPATTKQTHCFSISPASHSARIITQARISAGIWAVFFI